MIVWLTSKLEMPRPTPARRAPNLQRCRAAVLAALAATLPRLVAQAEDSAPSPSAQTQAESAPESAPDATAAAPSATPAAAPEAAAPGAGDSLYPEPYRPRNAEAPQAPAPERSHRRNSPVELENTPEASDAPESARRHRGFFMRFTTGVGAGLTRYREPTRGGDTLAVKSSGLSTNFEFAMGGAVLENLILHGNLAFMDLYETRREVGGLREGDQSVESGCVLLGAGLTYYVMPANVYVTVTSGVSGFTETRRGRTFIDSRAGVGATLVLGKEWWVGAMGEWGLGAALRTSFHTAKADVFDAWERVYSGDLSIVFSATLN